MPARVAGLRIPDEKPSGSCTYPGCTCTRREERALSTCRATSSRLRDANELATIHSEYISWCETGAFARRSLFAAKRRVDGD